LWSCFLYYCQAKKKTVLLFPTLFPTRFKYTTVGGGKAKKIKVA